MSAVLTPPRQATVPTPPSVTPPPVAAPVAVQAPPQPFRWTLEQYRDLDMNRLFQDKRTMLLDGVIYVMPNAKPPHSGTIMVVGEWASRAFPIGHAVRVQMPLEIGMDTEPNPDVAVVLGSGRDYMTVNPSAAVLVIEVAESSLFTDTTIKAEKYATAGVPDYWVIDLENRQVIVFRDPAPLPVALGANAYRQRNTFGPDATISPLAAEGVSIRVADLLP